MTIQKTVRLADGTEYRINMFRARWFVRLLTVWCWRKWDLRTLLRYDLAIRCGQIRGHAVEWVPRPQDRAVLGLCSWGLTFIYLAYSGVYYPRNSAACAALMVFFVLPVFLVKTALPIGYRGLRWVWLQAKGALHRRGGVETNPSFHVRKRLDALMPYRFTFTVTRKGK